MPTRELVKVLSIDGGGIRGIIPALVLAEIESRTQRPACELFDLIAGTSTGGIIALGVTAPTLAPDGSPSTSPRWSAQELAGLYENDGGKVFHRSLMRTIETVDGLLVEKYSAKGLEELLESCVGGISLSQALTDVLITSYDIQAHEPFFFKSFTPRERPLARSTGANAQTGVSSPPPSPEGDAATDPPPAGNTTADFPMTVVGRATSAAPTYFEPEDVPAGAGAPAPPGTPTDYVLVDGGTFANNPSMCAYAEAVRNHPEADVLIVSLGTGRLTDPISFDQAKHWGLVQWAHPLLGVIMDGASAATDYQLDELLGRDARHFRFQIELEGASDSLDDASPQNIADLRRCAQRLITAQAPQIEQVCELLAS